MTKLGIVLLLWSSAFPATAETLLGLRGASFVIVDPASGAVRIVPVAPPGGSPWRFVAQDHIRNRVFIDSGVSPSRISILDIDTRRIVATPFRSSTKLAYFYDEDEDALFATGLVSGRRKVIRVDLNGGTIVEILDLPEELVWADTWQFAAYDQSADRLYLTGTTGPGGEISEKALFVVDLDERTVVETLFRSSAALRFLPRTYGGALYAHLAQGESSQYQNISRIDPASGNAVTVFDSIPLHLMPPVADDLPSGRIYLRSYDDGRLFLIDLSMGTGAFSTFADQDIFIYAPHPAAVTMADIPALGTPARVLLMAGLAALALVGLRRCF